MEMYAASLNCCQHVLFLANLMLPDSPMANCFREEVPDSHFVSYTSVCRSKLSKLFIDVWNEYFTWLSTTTMYYCVLEK